MAEQTGPTVFISYSRKDKAWKDLLVSHLGVLEKAGRLRVWEDSRIMPGTDWFPEIANALGQTNVVVLLVSVASLTSDFILAEEVPRMLERRGDGLVVYPVLVRPCAWDQVPWLAAINLRPEGTRALSSMAEHEVESFLADMANEIADLGMGPVERQVPPGLPAVSRVRLRLPVTGAELFGRADELARLDAAWEDAGTNVISVVAHGGVGKSTLVNHWLEGMGADGWRGAARVYGWSFYSQGARQEATASADAFIGEALADFGDAEPDVGSPFQKGERLARLVKASRTLLVLDGTEPLQDPIDGRLRDPALASVLRELAADNPGLCVVTTRQAVADLASHPRAAAALNLDTLGEAAGAAYLRALGVEGPDGELRAASWEFGGHALALKLLGSYLREAHAGDVRLRSEVALLEEDAERGGHAWRVMESYEGRLDAVETAVARVLGLFDRPADAAAMAALRAPPAIPGLTDGLEGVPDARWNRAVIRLRDAGLVAAGNGSGALDAHPLVREYFARRLRDDFPEAWRAGNGRLFDHFKDAAAPLPDTREEMEPLFAAVTHGCRAWRYEEALDDVLYGRIDRRDEAFAWKNLGLFGSRLGSLSGFFDPPWVAPVGDLSEVARAWLPGEAGLCLRALGRLADAVAPMTAGLEMRISQKSWVNAARQTSNLSELRLTLGFVATAIEDSERAVELADRSGEAFERMAFRATHANSLAQAGRADSALTLFREAEGMQKEDQPDYPFLYSVQGFEYCELLLDLDRAAEVRERAGTTLVLITAHGNLLSIALDHLSLGRAAMALEDAEAAAEYLDAAVEGLRRAGQIQELPRGLLARAEFRRERGDVERAARDLREALDIAERIGARLFEADARLGQGRDGEAREELGEARRLVEETGYHRRDRDVAALTRRLGGG